MSMQYIDAMRLTEHQRQIIRDEAAAIFGEDAVVRLFGSRLDDAVGGGDIDLLVEADTVIPDSNHKSLRLVARMQRRLGDQSIDVLVIDPDTMLQPVHEQVRHTGVAL